MEVCSVELFDDWCEAEEEEGARKRYWVLTEKIGGRDAIRKVLATTIRSHYGRLERIADDVARLGYKGAATILETAVPKKPKARSGDLGEILATELVEEKVKLSVPVRRLRYKDGREMAMRGDDFIGAGYGSSDGKLWLLKGEAKSNKILGKSTITKARKVLNRDNGRCTPDSLFFIANRLLESAEEKEVTLGRTIRDEVGCNSLRPDRIDHMLFTVSGNLAPKALKDDLRAAGAERDQYVVNLQIEDHQEFIAEMYEKALNLGDD
jgi:hypothetical protein